jgi:NAD-dependent deacetylase
MADTADIIPKIAELIKHSSSAIAFTGAGISTESGIPDFRSPNGIWAKYQPVYYQDFLASADARSEYWRQKCEGQQAFGDAQPNVGHQILARWESTGLLRAVITQNIDGLHQQAGSNEVLELHGTARRIICVECGTLYEVESYVAQFLIDQQIPQCEQCGGWLKHATVSFGQTLPPDVFQRSATLCKRADLVLAIGSSLVVEPAASLPRLACQRGAKLVIINRTETGLDALASFTLQSEIGKTLEAIDQLLQN